MNNVPNLHRLFRQVGYYLKHAPENSKDLKKAREAFSLIYRTIYGSGKLNKRELLDLHCPSSASLTKR